jgi:uncharacterized protein (UPF0261 family)
MARFLPEQRRSLQVWLEAYEERHGGQVKKVYVIGTCDTKGDELDFAVNCMRAAGVEAVLVDVSTTAHSHGANVAATTIAASHPMGAFAVLGQTDRGIAVSAMAKALSIWLPQQEDIAGVLGLGGSGNTAIVTQAMRTLPVGVPKVMLSTLASGNVAGFVGPTDICMMHSVVDIAGLNAISRKIISNASHAVVGMVQHAAPIAESIRPCIGMTMFGVTTSCITQIRKLMEPACESYVFHATGTGGQSFEKLAESGYFEAVFDITTTEVADYLFGGVLPCTADRFGAFIRNPIPYVGSVGAVDMVNFGARDAVPEKYKDRKFHIHNAHVSLMRTTADENRAIGTFIVERLNQMGGPVRFLLPLKGVSAIDAEGQSFHDPAADMALFDAIRQGWQPASNRKLIEIDAHINDPAFATSAVAAFKEMKPHAPL